jgi:eukaryotic-like serine/threonine-protein kinase
VSLSPGARLGPYTIVSVLGAGGMGEVYRARDPRLERDVAVKVLPLSFATDADRLRRFEQEARAAGQLNHPGILAIHDVGADDGVSYVVSELLEGETLRERLASGPLGPRRALDYARQMAEALAAAHDRGIVHRDLKPENVFVTRDGHVKILDFGLAKLARPESLEDALTRTAHTPGTEPGMVLGTVGYMSPEQVRGQAVDHRSDVFSLGAILYEMLSGRRAFRRDSSVETMNAILKEEPPDLASALGATPGLDRIVRHCLEKRPEDRFQSTRDLAFDLQALPELSTAPTTAHRGRPPRAGFRLAAGGLAALLLLAAFFIGRGSSPPPSTPSYRRVTFRAGTVLSARFAPDGQTIVYAAAWEGRPLELFSSRLDSPETRPLDLARATIFSVSAAGEMALGLGYRFPVGGMLARMPIAGGAPREVLDDVFEADWGPDGKDLAVIRGGRLARIEYPIGKPIYESSGYATHVRVSPGGDAVAFIDHPVIGDTGGAVLLVDRAGRKRTLSDGWAEAWGLAWKPDGSEVWFTSAKIGTAHEIEAASLDGKTRLVARVPGELRLHDIARDGRVLFAHGDDRVGAAAFRPG